MKRTTKIIVAILAAAALFAGILLLCRQCGTVGESPTANTADTTACTTAKTTTQAAQSTTATSDANGNTTIVTPSVPTIEITSSTTIRQDTTAQETTVTTAKTTTATTTKKTTATTKPKYKTIQLNVKTTYFGFEGYFTKNSKANDIDRSILGLPSDYRGVGAVATEYYDVDDDCNVYFAVDTMRVDFIDLKGYVDSGEGRFMVPVKTKEAPTTTTKKTTATTKPKYKTITLYEKTTYFGYTGYFYKRVDGLHIYHPEILGFAKDYKYVAGACTEYYDVDTKEYIYFAVDDINFTSMFIASEIGDACYNTPVKTQK